MTLKKLFKTALKAALSSNGTGGFDATNQLNQMAFDDHIRAHNQAMRDHQHHMDMHMNAVNHFHDFHMMGPHF